MNGMTLSSFTAINSKNVCLNNYGCSAIKMFTIARNVNSNREWQPSGNLTLKILLFMMKTQKRIGGPSDLNLCNRVR